MYQFNHLFGSIGAAFWMPGVDEAARTNLLKKMFRPGQVRMQRLVLGNICTMSEVEWIRDKGGYICHLNGRPSNTVPMGRNDYLVTTEATAQRNYEPVEEVYSKILLHYKALARSRR